jgi:hypothetical protein
MSTELTSVYESIEIRKVKNGVIVTLRSDDADEEYVWDNDRKALKFVKEMLEVKNKERQT